MMLRQVKVESMATAGACPAGANICKEVVTFVIHQDVGREILDGNFPNGFHTQLWILNTLNGGNAVLGEVGSNTADRPQIETTELLAGIRYTLGAVTLGNHNHAATVALEEFHV